MTRLWRLFNKWWARFRGYFWLPCPRCGRMFGGHEWRATIRCDRSLVTGHAVCCEGPVSDLLACCRVHEAEDRERLSRYRATGSRVVDAEYVDLDVN